MKTFAQLYQEILSHARVAMESGTSFTLDAIGDQYDPAQLACLLHPHEYAPVVALGECPCDEPQKQSCQNVCMFGALVRDADGSLVVDARACTGCGDCLEQCKVARLVERKDLVPVLELLTGAAFPVYVLMAPAASGQFGDAVSMGMLRSVCKQIGFSGLVEVSLFADILTLKEALEFQKNIKTDGDYLLTSCCCPVWIAMIRRIYTQLVPHMPPSVSPMIAAGRVVKRLHPNAKTVFVGPCLAKKAEIRESELAGAIDVALDFTEFRDLVEASGIPFTDAGEDSREHSSAAGRLYAKSGGVSEAVHRTVDHISAGTSIAIVSHAVSGTKACKTLLEQLSAGIVPANFLEGMGCVGGCVGGPRRLVDVEVGKASVELYASQAPSQAPLENPSVPELLERLGYGSVEALLEDDRLLSRSFFA